MNKKSNKPAPPEYTPEQQVHMLRQQTFAVLFPEFYQRMEDAWQTVKSVQSERDMYKRLLTGLIIELEALDQDSIYSTIEKYKEFVNVSENV